MSKPNNRLIKLSMEQLRKIDISRAEIFHGVAKHMPNTPEARLLAMSKKGFDERLVQAYSPKQEYSTPYELDDGRMWRDEMRIKRKINQLAKAASSYQTPKK